MTTRHGGVSRREFLAAAGALPFAAAVLHGQTRTIPVGLELYSVRDALMKDLHGTVTAVAALGYQIVEFYAPYFSWTPAAAGDVRTLLDALGLACRSTHNDLASFTGDGLKKAIELNQIIGSRTIVLASAPGRTTLDGWKQLGEQMTGVMETLRPLAGRGSGFQRRFRGRNRGAGSRAQLPQRPVGRHTPPGADGSAPANEGPPRPRRYGRQGRLNSISMTAGALTDWHC